MQPSTIEFIGQTLTALSIPAAGWSAWLWNQASKVPFPPEVTVEKYPGEGIIMMMDEDMARYVPEMKAGVERMKKALVALEESSRLNAAGARWAMIVALLLAASFGCGLYKTKLEARPIGAAQNVAP